MAATTELELFTGAVFAEYLERQEFYFIANGIGTLAANVSEKNRAQKKLFANLIASLSREVYATLKSLCLPDRPADRSFEEVYMLLKKYYEIKTSTTTASFQFRLCHQKPAERLVDFCNRLKRAAVPCEFGSHLDRALKD